MSEQKTSTIKRTNNKNERRVKQKILSERKSASDTNDAALSGITNITTGTSISSIAETDEAFSAMIAFASILLGQQNQQGDIYSDFMQSSYLDVPSYQRSDHPLLYWNSSKVSNEIDYIVTSELIIRKAKQVLAKDNQMAKLIPATEVVALNASVIQILKKHSLRRGVPFFVPGS